MLLSSLLITEHSHLEAWRFTDLKNSTNGIRKCKYIVKKWIQFFKPNSLIDDKNVSKEHILLIKKPAAKIFDLIISELHLWSALLAIWNNSSILWALVKSPTTSAIQWEFLIRKNVSIVSSIPLFLLNPLKACLWCTYIRFIWAERSYVYTPQKMHLLTVKYKSVNWKKSLSEIKISSILWWWDRIIVIKFSFLKLSYCTPYARMELHIAKLNLHNSSASIHHCDLFSYTLSLKSWLWHSLPLVFNFMVIASCAGYKLKR